MSDHDKHGELVKRLYGLARGPDVLAIRGMQGALLDAAEALSAPSATDSRGGTDGWRVSPELRDSWIGYCDAFRSLFPGQRVELSPAAIEEFAQRLRAARTEIESTKDKNHDRPLPGVETTCLSESCNCVTVCGDGEGTCVLRRRAEAEADADAGQATIAMQGGLTPISRRIAELEKDAARYRWLRNPTRPVAIYIDGKLPFAVDSAIDAELDGPHG